VFVFIEMGTKRTISRAFIPGLSGDSSIFLSHPDNRFWRCEDRPDLQLCRGPAGLDGYSIRGTLTDDEKTLTNTDKKINM
jgi:hypothetical protein